MLRYITIEEYLSNPAFIIDARAPVEYEKGHILNS